MKRLLQRPGALVLASYVVISALQAWPLPLHLTTHLTGSPDGDGGVYIWNTWVFRHELGIGHWLPFSTETVLPLNGPTDLSLHNYTIFADLVALPLQPIFGIIATFNLIYLLNVTLAGLGMYCLARRLTGRTAESWLAGLLFMCSPFLATRGAGHYSLVAAAPLPLFVCAFERWWTDRRLRDAALVGVIVAWAAGCDPYYAVYCLMLALAILGGHLLRFETVPLRWHAQRLRWSLNLAMAVLAVGMFALAVGGGSDIHLGPLTISVHSLYTPMLIFAALLAGRLYLALRPRLRGPSPTELARLVRPAAAVAVVAVVLLAPQLYAMGQLVATGRLTRAPVGWRSSAPGADLVAFFIPNPDHPLMPAAAADWLSRRPGGGYADQVASLSYVALVVIGLAWWRAGFRPTRFWTVVTLGFATLTLGPFLQVAGWTTFVPTPWTLLRYVPLIGDARMPSRFDVVVMMGLAAIFAAALAAWTTAVPHRRRLILVATGLCLAAELLPAPRRLYAADIPHVYQAVAADPRPIRVLDLPFGIRDGLMNVGNFGPAAQFYQTFHQKGIIGGYLSRIPQSDRDDYFAIPMIRVLSALSENKPPAPDDVALARISAHDFLDQSRIGYVVMDDRTTSPELRAFAIEALDLARVETSPGFELFVPRAQPGKRGHRGL
jgi:hypothetical protein